MCNKRNGIQQVNNTSLNQLYSNMNQQCVNCINDCKDEYRENCPNIVTGLNITEIRRLVRDQRINIPKLCEKYNLKSKYMNDMLEGKILLKYKYRYYLEKELFKINK